MTSAEKDNYADVKTKTGKEWFYTDVVKKHFFNPKNLFKTEKEAENYKADGVGIVGSPACGDMMKMWIKVDPKTERIKDCKWQTFGCASAIASTSMLSVMITEKGGMKLDKALQIKPQDIVKRLVDLPPRKFHCSVLGDKALREAINVYFEKSGQKDRVVRQGAKIIDKQLKITDKDIEEAVLEGATTFEAVQKKTKIGVNDKSCIPEAEQLIRFYREKYFGPD
ncbi:iron-sulfur cluster assembly scaffold protein [Candidatus Woesearchaeota archaeon]|nr:iron-sulfur cluster assembly scaffold protein [Candidatus Woesearchaeota archaeon]